jgi:hypothetical protein
MATEVKRFYKDVDVAVDAKVRWWCMLVARAYVTSEWQGGYTVLLDRRQLKTPKGTLLSLPSDTLAELVAYEWYVEVVCPSSLYVCCSKDKPFVWLQGGARKGHFPRNDAHHAHLQHGARQPHGAHTRTARRGTHAVLCHRYGSLWRECVLHLLFNFTNVPLSQLRYRVPFPERLVERMDAEWNPVIEWFEAKFGGHKVKINSKKNIYIFFGFFCSTSDHFSSSFFFRSQ